MLAEALPGQESAVHNGTEAPADWGSDCRGDGSEAEGAANRERNGGMRFFREIDAADREDREAEGLRARRYTWRSVVGPTPDVNYGDLAAARDYLRRLEEAIERGGWTSSEAAGLYLARKIWSDRAKGMDPRYMEVGNRKGGLTKGESAAIEMRRIVIEMQRELEKSGRSNGD